MFLHEKLNLYRSFGRKPVSNQPPLRSGVRVSYTAAQLELLMNWSSASHFIQQGGYSLTQGLSCPIFLKVTSCHFCLCFLIGAHHHHQVIVNHHCLTCWLWSLSASGQRSSPEPRHTGRRASHWGCSSGSYQRFWSCLPQTQSTSRTHASVFSPPWWKGLIRKKKEKKKRKKNIFGKVCIVIK